jgi:hypothetical protein
VDIVFTASGMTDVQVAQKKREEHSRRTSSNVLVSLQGFRIKFHAKLRIENYSSFFRERKCSNKCQINQKCRQRRSHWNGRKKQKHHCMWDYFLRDDYYLNLSGRREQKYPDGSGERRRRWPRSEGGHRPGSCPGVGETFIARAVCVLEVGTRIKEHYRRLRDCKRFRDLSGTGATK